MYNCPYCGLFFNVDQGVDTQGEYKQHLEHCPNYRIAAHAQSRQNLLLLRADYLGGGSGFVDSNQQESSFMDCPVCGSRYDPYDFDDVRKHQSGDCAFLKQCPNCWEAYDIRNPQAINYHSNQNCCKKLCEYCNAKYDARNKNTYIRHTGLIKCKHCGNHYDWHTLADRKMHGAKQCLYKQCKHCGTQYNPKQKRLIETHESGRCSMVTCQFCQGLYSSMDNDLRNWHVSGQCVGRQQNVTQVQQQNIIQCGMCKQFVDLSNNDQVIAHNRSCRRNVFIPE